MVEACYVCIMLDGVQRQAVTLVNGTSVCEEHVVNIANGNIVASWG